MYPAPFDYHAPTTIKDALALLRTHGDHAKLLAGGHSLIPVMKLRLIAPPVVIDLGRVRELVGIREEGGTVVIGAMTTHAAIEQSALIRSKVPLLAEVAPHIGDLQVRNRGTIGGSVAHADPAADWPAALLALDAQFVVTSGGAPRVIPSASFFLDLLTTALEPSEILTEIRVPVPATGGHAYEKVRQPASGFALVGIAVQLAIERRVCKAARIGVTGVTSHAVRGAASERILQNQPVDAATIALAAEQIASGLDVLDDLHASSEFRAQLARVHARRALARAAGL